MDELKLNNGKLQINDNSVVYLFQEFDNFDIDKLIIEKENINYFTIKYSYSFDSRVWSIPKSKEEFDIETSIVDVKFFIAIWFEKIPLTNNFANKFDIKQNINHTIYNLLITDIIYDGITVDLETCKISVFASVINELPRWNFYDNQTVNLRRWKEQCKSLSFIVGHAAVYFKTEATEISHTLATNINRNVVSIKKIFHTVPGNNFPTDRTNFSEWDMALFDDFLIEINIELFEEAFGNSTIPTDRDYLYIPILNRMYKVSSVQTGKPFMGQPAWWDCYLAKYEEDVSVGISSDLLKAMSPAADLFSEAFDTFEELELIEDIENVVSDKKELLSDTVLTKEKLQEKNIDEKKEANNRFSNITVDSTNYIDLKETESQRRFYSKRLNIVSVNPDNSAFPITMYNCETIEKRTIALIYDLIDATSVNKHTLIISESFKLFFNIAITKKFVGEVLDLTRNTVSNFTLKLQRGFFYVDIPHLGYSQKINFDLEENELYQIAVSFNSQKHNYIFEIYKLKNKIKTEIFKSIYNEVNLDLRTFDNIVLLGGTYLINDINYFVNNLKIIEDKCLPVLKMQKFSY